MNLNRFQIIFKPLKTLIFSYIFGAFIFLLIPNLYGGELKRPLQGTRNLGMGNVGVALSHDENALIYNPAGMAGADTVIVGVPFVFEISDDIIKLISEAQNLSSSSTGDTIKTFMGKRVHLRSLAKLNVLLPFGKAMTLGAIYGGEINFDLTIRNPVSPQFKTALRAEKEISNGGVAFSLDRGRWLVGLGVEKYKRCDIPLTTISLKSLLGGETASITCGETDFSQGQTYSFGFQQRLESVSTLRMVWGMSARNLGGLNFERKSGATNPIDQKPEYNFGIAITPFDSMGFRNFYEFDYRDITFDHADDASYCNNNKFAADCNYKHIHIGTEFGFFPVDSATSVLALRFGWNQGYYSYGFELNPFIIIRTLNIQFASYKAETGDASGEPEGRKVLQINLGF